MKNNWIYLVLGHRSFTTGKIVLVSLPQYVFIDTYRDLAKKKACEKLGLNEDEISILDWKFLGEDIAIFE